MKRKAGAAGEWLPMSSSARADARLQRATRPEAIFTRSAHVLRHLRVDSRAREFY